MIVDLYELRLVKRVIQQNQETNDECKSEFALLDSAYWVKCDLDSRKKSDGSRSSQRNYLRLQSLIQFKQCFAKALILFDPPPMENGGGGEESSTTELLGQYLADRMGVPKSRIQVLFHPTRFINSREDKLYVLQSTLASSRTPPQTNKKCEISIVDGDVQTSRKIVQSMISRQKAAEAAVAAAQSDRTAAGSKLARRVYDSICTTWRRRSDKNEMGEKGTVEKLEDTKQHVQICVGAIGSCSKLQMIFARFPSKNSERPKFVIFIIGPPSWRIDYLELGRCCAVSFTNQIFVNLSNKCNNTEQFRTAIDRFLDNSVVIPPEPSHHWTALKLSKVKRMLTSAFAGWTPDGRRLSTESENSILLTGGGAAGVVGATEIKKEAPYDPLRRTGKLFHGFLNDIRHRYRDYAADLTDAFRMKCVVATILTFFNTFTSAIALGEVLGTKTKRWMGLSEVLVAQCVCGLLWGLLAGQPLIIQTTTAAFVMFEGSLYKFCDAHGLEYLVIRVWTGGWVLLLTIVMVMLEAPFLIRYVTRFTEEVFDALISVVFIYESLLFLFETFEVHPLRDLIGYCELANSSTTSSKSSHHQSSMDGHGAMSSFVAAMFAAATPPPGDYEVDELFDNSTAREPHDGHGGIVVIRTHEFSPIAEEEFHYDHGHILGQPNSALLTLILMMATFFLASYLDSLKRTCYFGRTFRELIGNFSVPIALPLIAMAADLFFQSTHVHRVDMADDFAPTEPTRRGWFVNPLGMYAQLPMWAIFAAIAPAFLVSILLFVELELAEFSFARKERGLRKGSGFHSDLLLSGLLMFICGLMGLPWLGAGPVQSRAHLATLTVRQRAPPGEDAKIDHVVEQRLTSVAVALLLGACAFLGRALIRIPVAVLMGVFVYLGVRSLCELQFIRRVILYIVPTKYYPDKKYCQQVPMWRMHMYTAIQILCFAALFAVEVVPQISVVFPFVVTIIAVFRHIFLPLAFQNDELNSLDAEQEESDMEDSLV